VDKLEVVLANGELIQTGRMSKKELDHKKGQTGLEADIYRHIDGIITDNLEAIKGTGQLRVSKNSSGYALADVKRPDGSFDLTPLIVGSQGTLGIITEAIVKIEPYSPKTQLIVAEFTDLSTAHDSITELLKLHPSALEMVDRNLLEFVSKQHANLIKNLVSDVLPAIVLLVEFDDISERARKVHAKKAMKVLSKLSSRVTQSKDYEEQQKLWGIRYSSATVVNHSEGGKSALPIIEDGIVPHEEFEAFITGVYELFAKYRLQVALWGHAGDANLHMLPLLDLAKMGDRQTVIKLMQEYYDLVLSLGGSISAENNDGRLRAAFVEKQFGEDMVRVFAEVKQAFDPHGMMNPGVKLGTSVKDLAGILQNEYSVAHLSDYLPHA
ncbi:MAG: FAD-binding oxidoreductase, partial [Microcoleus sp.]